MAQKTQKKYLLKIQNYKEKSGHVVLDFTLFLTEYRSEKIR